MLLKVLSFVCQPTHLHCISAKTYAFRNLTPEDPLWYGAWWIGFIFTGALSIVVSVPVFSFARRLPG